MKNIQSKVIFLGVLLYAFAVQVVIRSTSLVIDKNLWASQIEYFLNRDPRAFDMLGAYGHPGTTLLELGSLFHLVLGTSYGDSLILGVSLLIAAGIAACATLCFLLYPRSLWWITTAFTMTFTRFFIDATPPTAVIMPFIALVVMGALWLWEQSQKSWWLYGLWGCVIGFSAATRLDMTALVGLPMIVLLLYRHGRCIIMPVTAGITVSFFIADPFLWFMPVQHILDLIRKFTFHHDNFSHPTEVKGREVFQMIVIGVICIIWWFALVGLRRKQVLPIPMQIIAVFLGISLLAGAIILSSTFQALRYFYPLVIVWEIFLPLFVLETFSPTNRHEPSGPFWGGTVVSWSIVGIVIVMQILAYGLTI